MYFKLLSGSFAVKTTANAPTPISSLSTKFLYEKRGSSLKSKSDLVVRVSAPSFRRVTFYFNEHAELFLILQGDFATSREFHLHVTFITELQKYLAVYSIQLQSRSKVVGTPTVSRYICLSTIILSKNLTSPSSAPPFHVGFHV